jgi:hypothetical protein
MGKNFGETASRVGALLVLWLGATSCGDSGEPSGGPLWNYHDVQLRVAYDTLPPDSDTPLAVEFDTLRNALGYPFLHVRVTATNVSDRGLIGLTGSSCHWMFTAYDNPERAGQPLWSGEDKACREGGFVLNLPPGATQVFPTTSLDLGEITKARGTGVYYFAARLRGMLGDEPPSRWLTERVPAGAVVLVP